MNDEKLPYQFRGVTERPGTVRKVNVIQLANLWGFAKSFSISRRRVSTLSARERRKEFVVRKKAACKAQTNHQHKLEFLGNLSSRN